MAGHGAARQNGRHGKHARYGIERRGKAAFEKRALSDAEKQRLKNAPTKCPSCASPLAAPILRGQTEIKCPACGTVTRF
ncbi:MAG: hypothetical protein DCC52_18340 [Chloroflexi bacterium]|nr:MAG: hypothetical protein DCC52_18340 [Chloroflexota bacterium]